MTTQRNEDIAVRFGESFAEEKYLQVPLAMLGPAMKKLGIGHLGMIVLALATYRVKGGHVWPSVDTLAQLAAVSRSTVKRQLHELEDVHKLIKKVVVDGRRRTNTWDVGPLFAALDAAAAELLDGAPAAAARGAVSTGEAAALRIEAGAAVGSVLADLMPSVRASLMELWPDFGEFVAGEAGVELARADRRDAFECINRELAVRLLKSRPRPWQWTVDDLRDVVFQVAKVFKATQPRDEVVESAVVPTEKTVARVVHDLDDESLQFLVLAKSETISAAEAVLMAGPGELQAVADDLDAHPRDLHHALAEHLTRERPATVVPERAHELARAQGWTSPTWSWTQSNGVDLRAMRAKSAAMVVTPEQHAAAARLFAEASADDYRAAA